MRQFEKISKEQWLKDVEGKYYFNSNTLDECYSNIKLPQRATSKSAGYDIYSPINCSIMPNSMMLIPTGIKVDMENDDVMFIIIRSSLGIKKGLSIPNQTGVIDADYYNNPDNEGHVWVALKNNTNEQFDIVAGDRISQAIFIKYNKVDNDTPIKESRSGGIGSTN